MTPWDNRLFHSFRNYSADILKGERYFYRDEIIYIELYISLWMIHFVSWRGMDSFVES